MSYLRMMTDETLRLRTLRKWLDALSAYYADLAKPPLALPPPAAVGEGVPLAAS